MTAFVAKKLVARGVTELENLTAVVDCCFYLVLGGGYQVGLGF